MQWYAFERDVMHHVLISTHTCVEFSSFLVSHGNHPNRNLCSTYISLIHYNIVLNGILRYYVYQYKILAVLGQARDKRNIS